MPPMHQRENENQNGQRKKIWQESVVHDSAPATRSIRKPADTDRRVFKLRMV
jgi:hypothetical protein